MCFLAETAERKSEPQSGGRNRKAWFIRANNATGESGADTKDRFTATMLAKSKSPHRTPEVLFCRETTTKTKDIPATVPVGIRYRFSVGGSRGEDFLLLLLERRFDREDTFSLPRPAGGGLMVDQFAGYL